MSSVSYSPSATENPPATPAGTKSWLTQRREMLQLYTRCILQPVHYRLYRFYERDKDLAYMLNFLSVYAQKHLQRTLNDPRWQDVLDNKWLFHLHYRHFGLALPRTYGVYDSQAGITDEGEPLTTPAQLRALLERHRPAGLVSKPLGGLMGSQVMVLRELSYADGAISATTNTGERLSFDELVALLEQPTVARFRMNGGYKLGMPGYLLQEKVRQHAFFDELAPFTTNTVRVVTLLGYDNKALVLGTALRLGRRGNMVDNWDRGGISAGVDPKTGTLGPGVMKPRYGTMWVDTHPDTGVRFVGQTLPDWPAVLELCRRAAELTPNVRSIGWDVALTPDGPVLIEGNFDWGIASVQVHSRGVLRPEVREQLAGFGLIYPEHELPPFSPAIWWKRVREQYHDYAIAHPDVWTPFQLVKSYLQELKPFLLN